MNGVTSVLVCVMLASIVTQVQSGNQTCGPSCDCRNDTISLINNYAVDIPAAEVGTWGINNWSIALEFLLPNNTNHLPDTDAVFFTRISQQDNPFTGPSFVLFLDRLEVRMTSADIFNCTAGFPLPNLFFGKFQRLFVSFVDGVYTVEYGNYGCVSDVFPTIPPSSFGLFTSAPLRFGGNHDYSPSQNIEATIRNLQLCGD